MTRCIVIVNNSDAEITVSTLGGNLALDPDESATVLVSDEQYAEIQETNGLTITDDFNNLDITLLALRDATLKADMVNEIVSNLDDYIGAPDSTPVTNPDLEANLVSITKGILAALGATNDAAASGNGTTIGILKQLRALIDAELILLNEAWNAPTSALGVQMNGVKTIDVTFHSSAISPATGETFVVGGYKNLLVYITGTSNARKVDFKARPPGADAGVYTNLVGFKVSDVSLPVAASTTGTDDEVWSFDISNYQEVIMSLSEVSGGTVTIKGTAGV